MISFFVNLFLLRIILYFVVDIVWIVFVWVGDLCFGFDFGFCGI